MNDAADESHDADCMTSNSKTIASKFLEYKTKMSDKTKSISSGLDTKVVTSLKYLNNFWTYFDVSLINHEGELDL